MAFNWNAAASYLGERLPWTIAQDQQRRSTERQQGLSFAQSLAKSARETGNVGPENRLANIELIADMYPGADRSELQRIYDAQFPATVRTAKWGQTREDWDKATLGREISPHYDALQDPSAQWYYNPEIRDTQVSYLNHLTGEREWIPGSENIAGKPDLNWQQQLRMYTEMAEGPDKTSTGAQMARNYCAREGITQEQCDVFTQQVQVDREIVDKQIDQPRPPGEMDFTDQLERVMQGQMPELPTVDTPPGLQPTPVEIPAITSLEESALDGLPEMTGEAAYKRHLVSQGQGNIAKPGIVSDDDIAGDIASQRNQPPPPPTPPELPETRAGKIYDLVSDLGMPDWFPKLQGQTEQFNIGDVPWPTDVLRTMPEMTRDVRSFINEITGEEGEAFGREGLQQIIEGIREIEETPPGTFPIPGTPIDVPVGKDPGSSPSVTKGLKTLEELFGQPPQEWETEEFKRVRDKPASEVSRAGPNRFDEMNRAEMNNAALDQDVDGPLITALQSQESGGKHYNRRGQPDSGVLTGGKGDTGLMQVRQGAKEDIERKLGRRLDPNNPEDNITIGIHFLAVQLNNPQLLGLNGWRAALAAYNAGAAGVLGGIPQSTEQYVKDIEARLTTPQIAALDRKYGGAGTGV
mgnify:CR=1 FL=1